MGALPQAREIVFEVQMQMSKEKIARKQKKKKNFLPTHQTFFIFFLFGPLLLHSKLLTFSFLKTI
jgi:hypothetical protein